MNELIRCAGASLVLAATFVCLAPPLGVALGAASGLYRRFDFGSGALLAGASALLLAASVTVPLALPGALWVLSVARHRSLVREGVLTIAGSEAALAARALGATEFEMVRSLVLPERAALVRRAVATSTLAASVLELGLASLGVGVSAGPRSLPALLVDPQRSAGERALAASLLVGLVLASGLAAQPWEAWLGGPSSLRRGSGWL